MKKRLLQLIFLTLCLTLSACGSRNWISGEVIEAAPTALILESEDGQRTAVLMEEDTFVSGMEGLDGSSYKSNPHTGVKVRFFPEEHAGSVTASDGTEVKAYRTKTHIDIWAYLLPDAVLLSDGTVLDAWKTDLFGTTYQTRDGTELLREDAPSGPEHHHVGGIEKSFDDLSEAAKPRVAEFYEKQGRLYDLQAQLERAWAAYQEDPDGFSSFFVSQDSWPAAFSEQIFYFRTDLNQTVSGNTVQQTTLCAAFDRETGANIPLADLFLCPEEEIGFYFRTDLNQTVSGNTVQQTTLCAAFDRETGANIPLADLFLCPEEEIGKRLLDLAEADGTGPADPAVKADMEAAFRLEFLTFSQDSLELTFPPGSLSGQEHTHLVSAAFTGDCRALLQPWAVPVPSPSHS